MIEPVARANLIRIATVYARATDSTLSAVSRKFYGKAAFFADFKRGSQSITFSNLDRLLKAFAKEWPPGVDWPTPAPILMTMPSVRHPGKNIPKENVATA